MKYTPGQMIKLVFVVTSQTLISDRTKFHSFPTATNTEINWLINWFLRESCKQVQKSSSHSPTRSYKTTEILSQFTSYRRFSVWIKDRNAWLILTEKRKLHRSYGSFQIKFSTLSYSNISQISSHQSLP